MSTRVRWLGHSCLLFEGGGQHVLIDPFLTGNPKAAATADRGPGRPDPDLARPRRPRRRRRGDRPAHRRRRCSPTTRSATGCSKRPAGLTKVHGLQHGGGFTFDSGIRVKLTLAFHGSALPDGSNGGNPCGFLLTFHDGTKVYDAADTGLFGDMALIGEEGLDLAILPIGDYYTMGPDDALRAVKLLKPDMSCRSTTTRSRRSPRTPMPGPPGSRARRRPSPSSSSRGNGSRSRRVAAGLGSPDPTWPGPFVSWALRQRTRAPSLGPVARRGWRTARSSSRSGTRRRRGPGRPRPRRRASSGSRTTSRIARASNGISPIGTRTPVWPSTTTSVVPGAAVATTGLPNLMASSTRFGRPS